MCRREQAAPAVLISVVIPNRNGEKTLGRCLAALFGSRGARFEVIVADDCSSDRSLEVIRGFPCRLVRLAHPQGAAAARNAGAERARGKVLFFTDADCVVEPDTLAKVASTIAACDAETVVGGTYTALPDDDSFFSRFQSVFVRFCETKRPHDPDYAATHALAIRADTFRRHGGFARDFLPILEDVEFSHRLRRAGCRIVIEPEIAVRHIFDFTLLRSLRNACVKAMYWTLYSLHRGDLLADSGAASHELKANVTAWSGALVAAAASVASAAPGWLAAAGALAALDVAANRRLLRALAAAGGQRFAAAAALYYFLIYPAAVAAGALGGLALFLAGAGRAKGLR